ncbi:MAG: hypothetical protein H7Y01_01270 [Ferruginibacter sp.]|nr:hypothetical protein [Chitinophagaceae bacterium]
MRENEFEKRVQLKMKDFDLHPSEEVWMEVERRIRKEKKRRLILWWPLLFLLAGGGIAAILLTGKKEKDRTIIVNKKAENTIPLSSEKTSASQPLENMNKTGNTIIAPGLEKTTQGERNSIPVKKLNSRSVTILDPVNPHSSKKASKRARPETEEQVNIKDVVTADKQTWNQTNQPPGTVTVPSKPTASLTDSAKVAATVGAGDQQIQKKDLQEEPVKLAPAQQATESIDTKEKNKTADKKNKKWEWGISFSGGRSSIIHGLHVFDSPLYYNSPSVIAGSPLNLASASSSVIRPSVAGAAGLYLKRSVSEKLDIKLGFNYSYLSTRMNVGNRVDSFRNINNYYSNGLNVNRFYRPAGNAGNSTYNNQYHFISLSGDLAWRIINGKKIKIYWENGISYQRLFASSMLHYDRSLPGFYKDNSFLTKNHLFISTGFSIPVTKRWEISPFATYSLTPVLKNSDTLHFTNYGIRVRFLLNKK